MQLDIWMFFIVLKYAESENHSGFSSIAPQVGVFWLWKCHVTVILKFWDYGQN